MKQLANPEIRIEPTNRCNANCMLKTRSRLLADKEVSFIHIPKAGGTYVIQKHNGSSSGVVTPIQYLAHRVIDDARILNDLIWTNPGAYLDVSLHNVFATVRNPFSILVSYWQMRFREDEPDAGFSAFLLDVANTDNRQFARYGKSFMFCQLFLTSGRLAVDYIARSETMDADLHELCDMWGLSFSPGERQNEGNYAKHWRDYYKNGDIQFVRDHWPRELKMFGYDFNGNECDPMLPRIVTPSEKDEWHYDFFTDELTYRGDTL